MKPNRCENIVVPGKGYPIYIYMGEGPGGEICKKHIAEKSIIKNNIVPSRDKGQL